MRANSARTWFWVVVTIANVWSMRAVVAADNIPRGDSSRLKTMSLGERTRLIERVEEVYASNRAGTGVTASAQGVLSQQTIREVAEREALDTVEKSAALEALYGRSISPSMLQAELDRMARESRAPGVLRELFSALGNDADAAAEALARPALADRLLRAAYAADTDLHKGVYEQALQALNVIKSGGKWEDGAGSKGEMIIKRRSLSDPASIENIPGTRFLDAKQWAAFLKRCPTPGAGPVVEETPEGFFVIRTTANADGSIKMESLLFAKRPFTDWWNETRVRFANSDLATRQPFSYVLPPIHGERNCSTFSLLPGEPSPRDGHLALWTGSEMLFWGGDVWWPYSRGSGGAYNPATDTWRPFSPPPPDFAQASVGFAVWTGREMVLFLSGYWADQPEEGVRYDPIADTWTLTSRGAGCPAGIRDAVAVWTGHEVVIWGASFETSTPQATGGRYDPSTDTWRPVSAVGSPEARIGARAVWTGTEMILWGGFSDYQDYQTGGRYNPTTDTWRPTSTGPGVPDARSGFTAVWTGKEMIVWGGQVWPYQSTNTGSRYNPATDQWTPTTTLNAPDIRYDHTAIWTGTEMIIWGGANNGFSQTMEETPLNSGGRYSPDTDSWIPTSQGRFCPSPRVGLTAVWTGTEMLVWGGLNFSSSGYFDRQGTGAKYLPQSDSWIPMSLGSADLDDAGASGVWTGTGYIVWGGADWRGVFKNSGAVWDAVTNTWHPATSDWETPSPRWGQTAIWTGTEMIIWGGTDMSSPANPQPTWTGGQYDPLQDTWSQTYAGPGTPDPRSGHSAIWTGTKMIVWGGTGQWGQYLNSGGIYDPATNRWSSTSVGNECPSARSWPSAIWTGKQMILWGGGQLVSGHWVPVGDGALYDPTVDRWTSLPAGNGAPPARSSNTVVWTGDSMLVWGPGGDSEQSAGTGAQYFPDTGLWKPMATSGSCPGVPSPNLGFWTGTRLFVLGTTNPYGWADTAALYDPDADSWELAATQDQMPLLRSIFTGTSANQQVLLYQGYDTAGWLYQPCLSARAITTRQVAVGEFTVSFEGTAGGGAPPFTYDWDFGDGSPHASGETTLHSYYGPGTFAYTLTVTDSLGANASFNSEVVLNPLPTISDIQRVPSPFRLDISGAGFQDGAITDIGGVVVPTTLFKSSTLLEAGRGSELKALVPKGQSVTVRVTNPDGGQASFAYTR